MKTFTVRDYAQMALVAAIYVVLTTVPPLNAISYGPIQFRVSEMLNFLAFFHPKYLLSVTIGCMIANFYSYGLLDVFVGGGSTFLFVWLGVWLFSRYQSERVGIFNKAYLYFSVFFAASMFTIAIELMILFKTPFLMTWLSLFMGELASLLLGSLVIDHLAKRIDF